MYKKVFIVTNCDPKRVFETEQELKSIYLKKDPKPGITFAHNGSKPYEVANKSKDKKPAAIIFDEGVPQRIIGEIVSAVSKALPGRTPRFIQVNKHHTVPTVEHVTEHEQARELVAA